MLKLKTHSGFHELFLNYPLDSNAVCTVDKQQIPILYPFRLFCFTRPENESMTSRTHL